MVRAYVSARSARFILALILIGSMSGFVLGQALHHPVTPIVHAPSAIAARAAGSLGITSPIVSHSIKNVSHPAPAVRSSNRHGHDAQASDQPHHEHHRSKG